MSTVAEVVAAAGVGDPWQRAQEITGADPGPVAALGRTYGRAGEQAVTAFDTARRADRVTAASYLVDGTAVHDAGAATAASRVALGDAGQQFAQIARMLGAVAADLGDTRTGVEGELTALDRELRTIDDAAARTGPLLPAAAEKVLFERAVAAVRAHGGAINSLLEGYNQVLVSHTRFLGELAGPPRGAGTGTDAGPPPGGTAAQNSAWWLGLTDQQRRDTLSQHPELIGNLDGVPGTVRDGANRSLLGREAARIDEQIAATRAHLDAVAVGAAPGRDVQAAPLHARLEALHEQRAALGRIEQTVGPAGRQLLVVDLAGHDAPRAAVAIGNIDTARHVAVFVPGLDTTVAGSLRDHTQNMQAVHDTAADQLAKKGRQAEGVAAVAWLGYQAPQLDASTLDPGDSVLTRFSAQRGAEPLSGFLDGINASRTGHDPHLTAVAHSYGSTTAGYALQHTTTPVDDLVVFGSPGISTDAVSDLHVPAGHLAAIEARQDFVADAGLFGDDPNHLDGVRRLSAHDETGPDGERLRESVGHSEYLTPGTASQHNIAATVSGLAENQIEGAGNSGLGDVLRDRSGVHVP